MTNSTGYTKSEIIQAIRHGHEVDILCTACDWLESATGDDWDGEFSANELIEAIEQCEDDTAAATYRYEVRPIQPDADNGRAGELIGCCDTEDEARQLAEDTANDHYYGTVICRVGSETTDYDFGDGNGFVPWPDSIDA